MRLCFSFFGVMMLLSPQVEAQNEKLPVLMVHGIWDKGNIFDSMRASLTADGWMHAHALDLQPNDGSIDIPDMAQQVEAAAQKLMVETGCSQIDIVGFSMGALVSRYWIQKGEGKHRVRRFVSISGPHHGTWTAYFHFGKGGFSMRPNSPLLQQLQADTDPFGNVQVTCLWTPMDLMIVPAWSSKLPNIKEKSIPVILHAWMVYDKQVHQAVKEALESSSPDMPL